MVDRIEQDIGTIMQALVIGLLAWSLKATVELKTDLGIMQAKLEALQVSVQQGTQDRYRGTDAARDHAALWSELQRLENRTSKLEDKRR